MGKQKENKGGSPVGAFSRMNYLMQAAHLLLQTSSENPLANYYNKIMREISKKVVEKLHPDVKRTMCLACSYPFTSCSSEINVKVKSCKKKKRNQKTQMRKKSNIDGMTKNKSKKVETNRIMTLVGKYKKSRLDVRNKRPNKIKWACNKCGFNRCFLQKPSYHLWIYNMQNVINGDNL